MKIKSYLFKYVVYALSSLVLFSSYGNSEEFERLTKQQQWEKISLEVDRWTDGLGLPLDDNIKETVIALNAVGIKTRQSCEGHLDRALSYPWIDIDVENPEMQNLEEQIRIVREKRQQEEELLEIKYPSLSWREKRDQPDAQAYIALCEEAYHLYNEYNKAQKILLEPIYSLLKQFYQTHNSSYEQTLFIENFGLGRLQSIGGDWQQLRSAEEKEMKLKEYQEEMKKFAHFLKEIFYQDNF